MMVRRQFLYAVCLAAWPCLVKIAAASQHSLKVPIPTAGLNGTGESLRVWDTRRETLVVSEKSLTVNCTHKRRSVVINGTSPGPLLEFYTSQRVIITVINLLPDDNLTMHWHGLSMSATPWSDGTSLISQWPIAPNSSFQYEFVLYPEDAGTYFYHSHMGLQISTGSGPLIVHRRQACLPAESTPKDLIMYIQDYWNGPDRLLMQDLTQDPFLWLGIPNDIYLNGRSNGTSATDHCSLKFPVVDVSPDTTYRLRWIHAGSLMYMAAGIEQHNMTIIEADGTDISPISEGHIEVSPGQRLSAILTTKGLAEIQQDGKSGLYVINLSSRWREPGLHNFAVLRYNLNQSTATTMDDYLDVTGYVQLQQAMATYHLPNKSFGWIDRSLRAVVDEPPPENKNHTLVTLEVQQTYWGSHGSHWQVNGKTYHEWNVTNGAPPYLVQLYQGVEQMPSIRETEYGPGIYDPVSNTYVLEAGQVIDILIKNMPNDRNITEIHPWHFHSRKFWIMAQGQGEYNETSLEIGKFPHPYRRDMVNVYPYEGQLKQGQVGGWSLIRYQASESDAGVFPLHCHMSPHIVMGMLVIFVVSPSTLPSLLESYEPYVIFDGEMYGKKGYQPPDTSYFSHRVSPLMNEDCPLHR